MKTKSSVLGLIFVTQLLCVTNLFAVEVLVYGLEAMPFCGTVNGNPTGIAVDILNEATNYGAPKFTFNLDTPWARAQEQVQQAENGLSAIIPFSRSEQRENQFKWVAELVATQYRFFSFGRTTAIKSIDEIKNTPIGVVRGHAIIPMVKDLGLTKLDDGSPSAEVNVTKLLNKRYDTIADSDVICLYNWKKIGQSTKDLQPGPTIGSPTRVYIAAGLDFPNEVAKSISDAIEKMRKNGKLKEILDRWI